MPNVSPSHMYFEGCDWQLNHKLYFFIPTDNDVKTSPNLRRPKIPITTGGLPFKQLGQPTKIEVAQPYQPEPSRNTEEHYYENVPVSIILSIIYINISTIRNPTIQ